MEKHTQREAPSGSLCPFVFCVSSAKWSRKITLFTVGGVGRGHLHAAEQCQSEIIAVKRSDDVRTVTETNPVRIGDCTYTVSRAECSVTQSSTTSQLRTTGDGERSVRSESVLCSALLTALSHAEEGERYQKITQSTEKDIKNLENQKLKDRHKD